MSWKIKQKMRALLAAESNLCSNGPGRGGDLSICLVYPNRYGTGMGNLGFQTIYRLLTDCAGLLCERAFLPDREDLAVGFVCGLELPGFSIEHGFESWVSSFESPRAGIDRFQLETRNAKPET